MIIENEKLDASTGIKRTIRIEIPTEETNDVIKSVKIKGGRSDRLKIVWSQV